MPTTRISEILHAAGPRFQMHDPMTWLAQSLLGAEECCVELKKWQAVLDKGKVKELN